MNVEQCVSAVVIAMFVVMIIMMIATAAFGQGWPGYSGWDPCQYQWCPPPAAPQHHEVRRHREHRVERRVVHHEQPKPKPQPRHVASRPLSQEGERNAIHDRVISFCRRYSRDPACPQPQPALKPEEPKQ